MSHPSRVRGLKSAKAIDSAAAAAKSHPSRVRGLKSATMKVIKGSNRVAPFTGAWIEMRSHHVPSAGSLPSHPSRVRGLKLSVLWCDSGAGRRVAPFTGAWIEI